MSETIVNLGDMPNKWMNLTDISLRSTAAVINAVRIAKVVL
jgi:hypothetical protein